MERMTRKVCTLASAAATCKAPRSGREVKTGTCLYTATKAMRIGRVVQAARKAHADPVAAVLQSENGKLLFHGKVRDVMRRATEGWLRGTVEIDGLDQNRGETFRLDFQNEWSIGWQNGQVTVTVPDLICVMDSVSGEAIGTETIRYGQQTVAACRRPHPMSPKGLRHTGPRLTRYHKSIFRSGAMIRLASTFRD